MLVFVLGNEFDQILIYFTMLFFRPSLGLLIDKHWVSLYKVQMSCKHAEESSHILRDQEEVDDELALSEI